ncbi:hypothetical protein [Nitrospirillum iridis]|uniref:DUF4403 family protein n=1 Tax=Nitrospirillum iridis TaxID=765888 RepID=A0A7X0B2C4_9PROT|nr:hypothetical protein [Nitrospirillum iridis]MBB6253405.1 hypothetical protein [Nitrospirillum iridis]
MARHRPFFARVVPALLTAVIMAPAFTMPARAAAPATQTAADALAQRINDQLRGNPPAPGSRMGLTAGTASVTAEGDHYVLTLTGMEFGIPFGMGTMAGAPAGSPAETGKTKDGAAAPHPTQVGTTVRAGTITVTLRPGAHGNLVGDGILPSTITMSSWAGDSDGRIFLGHPYLHLTLRRDSRAIDTADLSASDVRFHDGHDILILSLGSLAAHWVMDNTRAVNNTDPNRLEINDLTFYASAISADAPHPWLHLDHQTLLSTRAAVATPDPANLLRLPMPANATARADLQGLTVMSQATPGTPPRTTFLMKAASLELDEKGMTGDRATIVLGVHHEGLTLPPPGTPVPAPPQSVGPGASAPSAETAPHPQAGMAPLIPTSARVHLTVTDVPFRTLLNTSVELNATPPATMAEQQARSLAVMQRSLKALGQAHTRLAIDGLDLQSSTLALAGTGAFLFDEASPWGIIGTLSLVLRQLSPGEGTERTPLAMAAMLQALGAPGKDEKGQAIHRYLLELDKAGHMLMNGRDMSQPVQIKPAGPRPAAPPPVHPAGATPG